MSTIPSVPPPLPPPLPVAPGTPPVSLDSKAINSSAFTSHICKWASEYPPLWEAAAKYNICTTKPPFKFKYKDYDSIIQIGPTCGLVALSMLVHGDVTPDELLSISKLRGYTCNGEMLSCKNMTKLMEKVLSLTELDNVKYNVKTGGLYSDETIEKLLNGATILVAYDADCNHSPCLRRGHTAHWALVCGVVVIEDPAGNSYTSNPNNVHVFTRHGKSKYIAIWKLEDLEKSNKNLWEFSPKKNTDGLIYVLPDGGLGGNDGLRNQYIIIEGL